MRHLVLGSRGQVGRYVVTELKNRGEEVVEWDIKIDPGHDLAFQERLDNGKLRDEIQKTDFVHFLAYEVGGSKYLAEHQTEFDFIDCNMRIMHNTFSILRKHDKPFYFASSQMSNMFHSVYGRLKAVGEAYTNSLPNGKIVHFWNVYGYEDDPEKSHVITDFIKQGIREHKILIRTDGMEERNFLYGKDAGKILADIAMDFEWYKQRKLPIPVTGLQFVSIKSVAEEIARQLGGIPVYHTDKKDTVQGMKNEIPSWAEGVLAKSGLYNASAAIDYWNQTTKLEAGVREMIELEIARYHEEVAEQYKPLIKVAEVAKLAEDTIAMTEKYVWRNSDSE